MSKKPPVKKRKLPKALSHSDRQHLKDVLDFDYLEKLSEEELAFLADYCEFYYQGNPHKSSIDAPKEESWRLANKARADIMNRSQVMDIEDDQLENLLNENPKQVRYVVKTRKKKETEE